MSLEASKQRLLDIVNQMQEISNLFYLEALKVDNPTFAIFVTLIDAYITVCRYMAYNNEDFTQCIPTKNGKLMMYQVDVDYIEDKMNLIFGSACKTSINLLPAGQAGGPVDKQKNTINEKD